MKNSILIIVILIISWTFALGQTGFEQYHYLEGNTYTFVPVVHVQTANNLYAEARYNYEEQKTFSVYLGKTFPKATKHLSYSFTPMVGGMLGQFKGGSAGLTMSLEYKKFFLSSQPQYTVFSGERSRSYFFQWSEVGYELTPWLFAGCSIQQTHYTQTKVNVTEAGVLMGFSLGKWIFPVYIFSPLSTSRYLVLGITYGLGSIKSIR
jgi:hypothetical protein